MNEHGSSRGEPLFRDLDRRFRDWCPHAGTKCRRRDRVDRPRKAAWWPRRAAFLEGFNRQMLAEAKPLWAVALPVRVIPGRAHEGGDEFP